MIELLFVRHGQTQNNKHGVLQGHLDAPLNDQGLKDAEELAEALKIVHFDKIFSSDLQRAMNCAEVIHKNLPNLEINQDPLLRERNFGDHQGISVLDIGYPDISYPMLVKHLYECDCPNGETNQQLFARINSFLEKCKQYSGKRILVVTHGGFIMVLLNIILKEKITFENSRKHKNGYVSYLKLDDDLNVLKTLLNVHCTEFAKFITSQ